MIHALAIALFAVLAEPDYSAWSVLLHKYYDPAKGMNYAALKAHDERALEAIRLQLGRVDVSALSARQQLAYWINVYNVNVVATVVEHYPVRSIRDISTDPIIRLNVELTPEQEKFVPPEGRSFNRYLLSAMLCLEEDETIPVADKLAINGTVQR